MEDNSKVHGKTDTRQNHGICNAVRLECHIYSIDWPPCSPNFNPIENIWKILKQRLRNRNPQGNWTIEDFEKAIINIWDNEISIETINRFVDTMPQRLELLFFDNLLNALNIILNLYILFAVLC